MIRILTTCYNARPYIGKTIESLQMQNYHDWHCYITDGISTDDSVQHIRGLIQGDSRFTLMLNKEKHYQPGNYWQILQKKNIDNEDICITLDGDDWLSDNMVLDRVLNYYRDAFKEKTSDDELTIRKNIWRALFREFLTDELRIALEGVSVVRWSIKWPDWFRIP